MKTYNERAAEVAARIKTLKKQRAKRITVLAASLTCVVALALVLFIPYRMTPADVSPYADSPYYELIQKINLAITEKPEYDNTFDALTNQMGGLIHEFTGAPGAAGEAVPDGNATYGGASSGNYVEVTDNQVEGVTEADIVKRSDRHIYHLKDNNQLVIYTIDGENSKQISVYELTQSEDSIAYEGGEMYLSRDLSAVYILRSCYSKGAEFTGTYLCVTVLDVSDVGNIQKVNEIYMTGSYLSSRMVEGDLLLMARYRIGNTVDFEDESSFLPQIGTPGNMVSIAAEDIYAPDALTSTQYTVVCKLSGDTSEVLSSAAFLSYSDELYVSENTVYATRSYTQTNDGTSCSMTQITALDYTGEKLAHRGSVSICGAVKDQYSMDEYEGILRVVTSTSEAKETSQGTMSSFSTKRNVNLYCIDLSTMQVAASVVGFAPEGEAAESVRFDGTAAYVCTAEVITFTDPVYFFDLSDIHNITWKDTGTIDGYSSSLVNFGNGFLLGIGYSGTGGLKIEVYEESADGVVSVCSYELSASFSENYKSYLIDRENQLIGLAVSEWETGNDRYLLFLFDGYELRPIVKTDFSCVLTDARAFVDSGWLYMVGNELKTQRIW